MGTIESLTRLHVRVGLNQGWREFSPRPKEFFSHIILAKMFVSIKPDERIFLFSDHKSAADS